MVSKVSSGQYFKWIQSVVLGVLSFGKHYGEETLALEEGGRLMNP